MLSGSKDHDVFVIANNIALGADIELVCTACSDEFACLIRSLS